MHYAVDLENKRITEFLLRNGVNTELEDNELSTAKDEASGEIYDLINDFKKNNWSLCKLLLDFMEMLMFINT